MTVTTVPVQWEDPVKMCGLRREVWEAHCSGDTHHDTWYMATPSPPPAAPRVPIRTMSPSSRAAMLNARFKDAHPSANLEAAGLVVHQFDRLEMKGMPWKSCNYHCDNELNGQHLTGRLSTFIMYGRMRERRDRVAIPLVSNDGGVIARPERGLNLSCVFGIDGASVGLSGGANGDGCPRVWCDPSGRMEANGYCGFWGAPPQAAWRPKDLAKLLELHMQHGEQYRPPGYHSGYNEAIVDGWSWNSNMPNTIEAFFELEGAGVAGTADGGRAQASYARDAHSRFKLEYGVDDTQVPLLKLDPSRWDAPFRAEDDNPVAILNDRFRMDPYGAWPEDGSLAWSGVLIHCIDGYENHNEPWKPEHQLMSASLIFSDQRVPGQGIPIFTCQDGGIIFRPGPVTRVVCGNGGDSGGGCRGFCDTPLGGVGDVSLYQDPGDGCGRSWRPKDFGTYLQRVSAWHRLNSRIAYNEILVDGAGPKSHWMAHLPDTIEAFFHLGDAKSIRGHHENYLRAYGLDAKTHPLVVLDASDWNSPFRSS